MNTMEKLKTLFYETRKFYSSKYIKLPFVNFLIHSYDSKPLIGCEIGVKYGEHAEQMCFHLNIKKLYLIDPYIFNDDFKMPKNKNKDNTKWIDFMTQKDYDDAYNIANKRLRDYPVKFIPQKSLDAVSQFKDDFFDFIFLDGNLKLIRHDIEKYYPKVRVGGVFGGHDFDAEKTIVNEAVIEFSKKYNLLLRGGNNEWWVKKGEINDPNDSRKWGINTLG